MIDLRLLWTWDHCTQWSAARAAMHDWGASNEYGGTAEDFLREYSLLVRWCGAHGIEGVVIWGLLRDGHGGVETVARLCDVAHEAGVKVLCGVGLNGYGGVYYEGSSPYCLPNHLAAHPELHAFTAEGEPLILRPLNFMPQPIHHACPSRPENLDYIRESLDWLMRTVPVDGVQMESGDCGCCQCPLCRERRQHPLSWLSWEDMALVYAPAAEAIWAARPDALVVLETYSSPEPASGDTAPGFGGGFPPWAADCLAQFPRGAHVQWVADELVPPKSDAPWTVRAPEEFSGNIMRSHHATWWRARGEEVAIQWLAPMARRAVDAGYSGLSIFGEKGPSRTGCELNYLALADCGSASNPTADLESFLDRVAAPLLGGPGEAREYLRLARSLGDPGSAVCVAALEEAADQARKQAARLSGRPADRWTWLASYLSRFVYDARS